MGRAKDIEIQKDDNWQSLCHANGWLCKICGELPPERGVRFDGDMCDDCRHATAKD